METITSVLSSAFISTLPFVERSDDCRQRTHKPNAILVSRPQFQTGLLITTSASVLMQVTLLLYMCRMIYSVPSNSAGQEKKGYSVHCSVRRHCRGEQDPTQQSCATQPAGAPWRRRLNPPGTSMKAKSDISFGYISAGLPLLNC